MKRLFHRPFPSWLPILPFLALLSTCGGSSSTPPAAPTGLAAVGALRVVHLSWTSGGPVVGHNIYRSADNVAFVKRNGARVGGTSYDDAIDSPAGDGVFYYYRITAVDTEESKPSAVVRAIHGTRLAANYPAGFTSDNTLSPYVLEGTTYVDNGNFVISYGDKLYILDNAVLSVEQDNNVMVNGLLRVLAASGATHATITSHPHSGLLANGHGFSITFNSPDDFNPIDNSGNWIRNTLLSNLMSGQAISISACSPRIENCKAVANDNAGSSYLSINSGAGPTIRNCSFDNMTLEVSDAATSASFSMKYNVFTNSYYSISFWNLAVPGVSSGQIANNLFDRHNAAYLWNVTAAGIPLDNNTWDNTNYSLYPTTTLRDGTTPGTASYIFTPTASPPLPVFGPNW